MRLATLRDSGHDVDDLALYAEKFDPILSRTQFLSYVDIEANAREVETYVARLRAAEALVLVFRSGSTACPAIMQGYFQRVFLPGVSTLIDDKGLFHPNLWNLRRMAAVCAYGEPLPARRRQTRSRPALRARQYRRVDQSPGAASTISPSTGWISQNPAGAPRFSRG